MPMGDLDSISFYINSRLYTVSRDIPPWLPLIDFLRYYAHLSGSKVLCREGGCGACTVVVTRKHTKTDPHSTYSVNACQVLLYMCHGWEIETVEALGSRHDGYHKIQKSLAGFFGTQCGFCSPGMVMAMHGKLSSCENVTMKEVESMLDGNLCRCTGYRPILDAFKALSSDATQNLQQRLADIEDLYESSCRKKGLKCPGSCGDDGSCSKKTLLLNEDKMINGQISKWGTSSLDITVSGVRWMRPTTLKELSTLIYEVGSSSEYHIVAGSTGQGVYKPNGPASSNYIDISMIHELTEMPKMVDKDSLGDSLKLGAMVTLSSAIKIFEQVSSISGFSHLEHLGKHWSKVANTSVRNLGTWAGNLILKHKHNEFPSDIFVTLAAVDAQLNVLCCETSSPHTKTLSVEDFLNLDMTQALIVSVILPMLPSNIQVRTYKVSSRATNSHAYVNAAFCFYLDPRDGITLTRSPKLLYGGISPKLNEASETQEFLSGHKLTEDGLMIEAAKILAEEMIPVTTPLEASSVYRLSLTQNLLYKAVVSILEERAVKEVRSAGVKVVRPLVTAQQSYDQAEGLSPVGKPLPKVEALQQVSGEVEFVNDISALPGELIAVFVNARIGRGKIKSIDRTKAEKACGVKAVLLAQDIPGINNVIAMAGSESEPLLAEDEVSYAGQAVALVVAQTKEQAEAAAKLVTLEYEDIRKPVLNIKEALVEGNWKLDGPEPFTMGDIQEGFKSCENILEGELSMGGQFHFALEPLSSRVHPIEDGYEVSATTQWAAEVQAAVAQVLDTEVSSVDISVRRIGGAFGGKISRGSIVASAAALGSWKTQSPVRMTLNLNQAMALTGGREPFLAKYKVGFDSNGRLVALDIDYITDGGFNRNEVAALVGMWFLPSVYSCPNITVRPGTVTTNTASNTFMRCPGIINAIATMENIMEHIAHSLGMDVGMVREINYAIAGTQRIFATPLTRNVFKEEILPLLKKTANLDERRTVVEDFNAKNRWHKRGLSLMPFWFNLFYADEFRYGILVNIYQHDGSVAVAHGGVEMGQGLNTKVSQIVSLVLGVELDKIKIKPTNSLTNANSWNFGATMCSDIVCNGVKIACERLKLRLDEVSKVWMAEKGVSPSWVELVQYSIQQDVDICERYWTSSKEFPKPYDIWGGACVEVEVDILTGQFHTIRCDLIEDCGQSLNPMVDIGQVEGGFVMGLGMMTSEKICYDPESGIKLTAGTWDYHPPVAQDIPADFRITLLPNSYNNGGVLRSKAVGEPPLCLSYCVITALRAAIGAARKQHGVDSWFDMPTPVTPEDIQQLCKVQTKYLSV